MTTTPSPSATPVCIDLASPCTGVCRIDDASGWCLGCGRSLAEIAAWSAMNDAEKQRVVNSLALRRSLNEDHGQRKPRV